eukprot:6929826-Pyramimonas_sp.AAC.1
MHAMGFPVYAPCATAAKTPIFELSPFGVNIHMLAGNSMFVQNMAVVLLATLVSVGRAPSPAPPAPEGPKVKGAALAVKGLDLPENIARDKRPKGGGLIAKMPEYGVALKLRFRDYPSQEVCLDHAKRLLEELRGEETRHPGAPQLGAGDEGEG